MSWLKRMNKVIDYIERHLTDEIDWNEIGLLSVCPAGLFQRLFAAITNIPLSEYIRRRRLTCAAFELKTSDAKIVDLAVKYGYESSDAFNVAFKRLHGVKPSEARLPDATLKAYPRLTFTLSIKGDVEMNYKIVKKEAFKAAGKIITATQENNPIPQFWADIHQDGTFEKICGMNPGSPILGVCYTSNPDGTFLYMAGVQVKDAIAEGMTCIEVPASDWAIFESIGPMPHAIQAVWKRIFTEFLPDSVYQHAGTPDLEVYYEGDNTRPDYRCEVWIPVRCKD